MDGMSSYQFVSSLAQCYEANAQLQGAGAGAAAPQDYYSMQYPNCYSPATQGYAQQYASMMGGAAPPSQDYTPPSSSSTLTQAPRPSLSRSPGVGAATAPSLTPAPLTQTNVQSCKYADSNVGSPQDLSTTSSGGTPQPGGMPGGPKSPDSDIEDSEPTSPMSPSPGGGGGASSSGTAGSTTKKEDTKSTPPQIYPWMKRVHLGQSK